MMKLCKHLWDQLVNDEERAKIWLSSLKTAALALGAQVLVLTGGEVQQAFAWDWKHWLATGITCAIAAGAKASDPVVPKS